MATEHVFTKGAIYTDNDFAVRVISRKGDFVTFKNLANDQTFRRKVKVTYVRGESYEVIDIREDWDKGFPIAFHVLAGGILPEFTEQVISRAKEWYKRLYADDNSQQEIATAEITTASDINSAMASQPANVAIAESETTAKIDVEEWVKRNEEAKIIRLQNARKNADRDLDDGLSYEECVKLVNSLMYTDTPRYKDTCGCEAVYNIIRDCKPNDRGELARYLTPNIYWDDASFIDKNDLRKSLARIWSEVEHMIKVLNTGHDVSAYHGVYTVWQDNFNRLWHLGKYAQPVLPANAESLPPDNLYDDDSFSDAPGDNSSPEQDIPESRDAESIHADIPGFTIVPSSEIKRPDYTAYPEAIHDDIPCINVPACYTPATLSHAAVVNPITAATMRFASIIAALLFVVYKFILPVIFMRKKDIRRDNTNPFMFSVGYKYPAYFHDKKQLLTVNERYSDKFGFSWLSVSDEDNISYSVRVKLRDDSYTELIDFKELERTCFAFQGWKPIKESNRAKYVKFEVGKSYTAHHRYAEYTRHFTILDRFAAVPADRPDAKHKTVWLKVRMSDSRLENEPVDGWTSVFVNRKHNSEEYWSTSEFIFRADQPDVVQEIPALTPEITHEHKAQQKTRKHKPAPASDLEHKLIDTKDLHFADKRRALDHNTAVITSCMFPEAVISLLMSISPQAIIQLGVHMGLFIAKPKGKKIAIAELFATKLMASRELRAHVRTNSEIISAKSTASIPDGVKFVQLKKRQLGFIFTD